MTVSMEKHVRDPYDAKHLLRIMGRELTNSEVRTFETLEEVTPEVVAVTLSLLQGDRILACHYLSERVEEARMVDVMAKVGAIEREAKKGRERSE